MRWEKVPSWDFEKGADAAALFIRQNALECCFCKHFGTLVQTFIRAKTILYPGLGSKKWQILQLF